MFKKNIFNFYSPLNQNEQNEHWDNIKDIYEIFLKIIGNPQCSTDILKLYITNDFLNNLVNLFNSDIIDERNKLKFVFHSLYKNIIPIRKIIRRVISNYLNNSAIQSKNIKGVEQILDVMASIISGYGVPLREENSNFFKNIILPLHNVEKCDLYFENLFRCVYLYLRKDNSLSNILLEKILLYFPSREFKIKILLLDEINETFELFNIEKMHPFAGKLCNSIVECFSEYNDTLKEKALSFFDNEYFISFIRLYKSITFNIIVPKVCYFLKNPWDKKSTIYLNSIKNKLKAIDLQKYIESKKIRKEHKIKLLPGNIEEEKQQIRLAVELSKEENKNNIGKDNKPEKELNGSINVKKSLSVFFEDSDNKEIKEEFDEEFGICPITQDYMENPVLCPSGNYYEKTAIIDWLKKHDTEPLTREHLTIDMLVEDKEYKKKIQEYRRKFGKQSFKV